MSFIDTLRKINLGRFAQELDEAFNALVGDCRGTGKNGEITIKLKLKPGKGNSPTITVVHDYKVKSPEFDRPDDYFFVTKSNDLVVDNPDQKKLDLQDVKKPAPAETEEVDKSTGEIIPVNRPTREVTPVARQ